MKTAEESLHEEWNLILKIYPYLKSRGRLVAKKRMRIIKNKLK